MSIVEAECLVASNPANGQEIRRIPVTPADEVPSRVERARTAQEAWGNLPWPKRREILRDWWRILSIEADNLAEGIRLEIGKPAGEAMGEVVSTLDALRWTVKNAGRVLADDRIKAGWQRWAMFGTVRLRWRPLGVLGVIGTWNYPIFLNAPLIAQALAAGNGVVWKPSELASHCGDLLQKTLEASGVPEGLVSAVQGGPEVGKALIDSRIDKACFTGGTEVGHRVLADLGGRGLPAIAELSGFDSAIVLPDAPLESTAKSLTWAAFVGCGQTCVAAKRVYVVGEASAWAEAFTDQTKALRVGDPGSPRVDVGPMISESARDRFDAQVQSAIQAGARVLNGAEFMPGPGWFYRPSVLLADNDAPEKALEGCFGPLLLLRALASAEEALQAANASRFGLSGSVWSQDVQAAQALAERLEAGMVCVNDAVIGSAHASAPFGGIKASGFGRVHGAIGLRELATPQAIHTRRSGGFRPQVFPYNDPMLKAMAFYRWMFHPRKRK